MVLSELTNKELKGILRENNVRNYSKLNKKGLLKKVNQLIKEQNGGKDGKGKNGKKKKYTLKDFIGGGETPADPAVPADPAATDALPAANHANPAAAQGNISGAAAPATITNTDLTPSNSLGATASQGNTPGAQGTATPGANAPGTGANPTGATGIGANAPGAKKNNAKKGNNAALYVYSANPKNSNSIGKAQGLPTPTQYGNIKPTNSSTNNSAKNKDECGSCSMQ